MCCNTISTFRTKKCACFLVYSFNIFMYYSFVFQSMCAANILIIFFCFIVRSLSSTLFGAGTMIFYAHVLYLYFSVFTIFVSINRSRQHPL